MNGEGAFDPLGTDPGAEDRIVGRMEDNVAEARCDRAGDQGREAGGEPDRRDRPRHREMARGPDRRGADPVDQEAERRLQENRREVESGERQAEGRRPHLELLPERAAAAPGCGDG